MARDNRTLDAWSSLRQTQIFMDRRDDWWAAETGFHAPPEMERIVGVPFVNTDRGAQLIATNTADITMDFPTAALIQNIIRQNPKVTTFSGDANPYGSLDWWESSLYFNMQSDNLPEKAVRRAMDLAIDRERLIAVAYTGASEALPDALSLPMHRSCLTSSCPRRQQKGMVLQYSIPKVPWR